MRIVLAGLALAALSLVGTANAADGETCQGKPATIVQTEGGVAGTDGDDVIFASGDQGTAGLSVQAGKGDDLICFGGHLPDGVTSVDAYADIDGGPGTDSLVYIGSAGEDRVQSFDIERIDIRTGEGIDDVWLAGRSRTTGLVDGGPEAANRNRLTISSYRKDGRVVVKLADEKMWVDGSVVETTGFYRVSGWADYVFIDGDATENRLEAQACDARLRGGSGDDRLEAKRGDGCGEVGIRLLGQKGDDRLRGSAVDDVLLGGPGADAAYGRGGRDRCDAEIEKTCER